MPRTYRGLPRSGIACSHGAPVVLRIDGPIPGGNLPLCNVLRCGAEGAYLATIDPGFGYFPTERLLCEEHAGMISAGEPWRWDDEQRVFLLGRDRDWPGAWVVSNFQMSKHNFEIDSDLGRAPAHVVVKIASRTGELSQELHLVLAEETAAELAKMLGWFGRREPEDEEP